jgi:hypothetical protein
MVTTACVADSCNVVDVDAQAKVRKRCQDIYSSLCEAAPQAFTRSAFATTFLARNWAMIEVRCLRS